MKRQNKYRIFIIVSIFIAVCSFCNGQTRDDEIAYYYNPDIISGRFADTNNFSPESSMELQMGTRIVFADVNDAKKILATREKYIQSLTPFDRSLRLKAERAVSEEEFLKYISEQAMEWSDKDKDRLKSVIESVANKIKRLELNLPPEIFLIKTTGKEEGGAAYCRLNAIVLPRNLVRQYYGLEELLIHELFHIYMRHNPKIRDKFYGIVNFKKCNTVLLPENLRKVEVTNPDVPKNEYYIKLQHEGDVINVMPVITVPNYNFRIGGDFFPYLKVQLLAVEKKDGKWQYKSGDNGKSILFEIRDIPSYRTMTGDNTGYVIHPEEVLADNFVFLVQKNKYVKSKWVIEDMEKIFKKEATQGYGIN